MEYITEFYTYHLHISIEDKRKRICVVRTTRTRKEIERVLIELFWKFRMNYAMWKMEAAKETEMDVKDCCILRNMSDTKRDLRRI